MFDRENIDIEDIVLKKFDDSVRLLVVSVVFGNDCVCAKPAMGCELPVFRSGLRELDGSACMWQVSQVEAESLT